MDYIMNLALNFQKSFWMWAIFAMQIASVALIIDRCIFLFTKRTINQKNLSKVLSEDIRSGNLESALRKSNEMTPDSPIGLVSVAGIRAAINGDGKEDIQIKMDAVLSLENSKVEKRIGLLAVFANVATMLGLLGTITGLIHSFSGISNVDPTEKSRLLSQGISLAMNTTAYGLIVAIPALVMYAVLQNRASRITDDLNKAALNIFIQLGYHYEPVANKKESPLSLIK